jgi:glycosyltransferase involved in cell wall biosynthesis
MVKKICFFLGHYDPARQTIMKYYERIFPKEVELYIVCAGKFDKKKYPLKRTIVLDSLGNKFTVPFKLRKFLKENEINLVTNLTGQAEVALTLFIATIFTKTKRVFYVLGNPKINLKNCFFLFSQFFTTGFLAICKEVADKFKKFLIFSRKKIFYIPFPINVHLFCPKDKYKLRKNLNLQREDKVMIYVGRIEKNQGSDYLLKVIQNNTDKKFILIGELMDENFKGKTFENVIHIPFVPNEKLPDYYNMANLSLFLSKRNAYPYPPRESLACGVPVVLFNLNTFGQLNTIAVKKVPFDSNKIQQEIDNFFLLSNKEKDKLSKEGRTFIIDDSSEEKIKPLTLAYFLKLLE